MNMQEANGLQLGLLRAVEGLIKASYRTAKCGNSRVQDGFHIKLLIKQHGQVSVNEQYCITESEN